MTVGKSEQRNMVYVTPSLTRLLAGCLLLSLTACGPAVSEKASGQATSISKGGAVGGAVVAGEVPRGSDQNDRKGGSSSQPVTDMNERDHRSIPGVPDTVVKELGSADARDRYRALDHWETKDNNASLEPVFEAMEDEDEAVRAKATAIVEQRWAEEHKKKRG
jgi:hypothetical protein